MEYLKESEKFAFGFGTEKTAGAGKVSEAVRLTGEEENKMGLPGLIIHLVAAVGYVAIKVFFGCKKSKKAKAKKLAKGRR